jgi:outer membrane protein
MNPAAEAGLRHYTSGVPRILMAVSLAAASAVGSNHASAQTAFTLPAPPLELPLLPPVSGGWTVMIGADGTSIPDFEGAIGSRFAPVPIFSIWRAGLG